ncbi:MAG: methyltransferase domain-containing protein [Woeseiaceae bacterium]
MIRDIPHKMTIDMTRDERARRDFVSSLRGHVLVDMADSMHQQYHEEIAPQHEREHGKKPESGPEVHKLMKEQDYFRFYSSIRYNAQEMVWRSVIPPVDRQLEALSSKAKSLDESIGTGSLTLNPALEVPRSVTSLDVHLTPGCYHSEFVDDDVATGAVYDQGLNVFAANMMGEDLCDIGDSMSGFAKVRHPELKPERILDMGCTIGHNTLPWAKTFPDAEVHAIDVAAPALRYAHARAQALDLPVHFRQMNATKLDYPDNHFDVVFSSMFLHELPLKDIRACLKEAHRVLKPGGMLLTMELPPNNQSAPYDSFYLDWDCYYNQEPFYKPFRDQDYAELVTTAGFDADQYFDTVMPSFSMSGPGVFEKAVKEDARFNDKTGRLTDGICWFGFGAFKS